MEKFDCQLPAALAQRYPDRKIPGEDLLQQLLSVMDDSNDFVEPIRWLREETDWSFRDRAIVVLTVRTTRNLLLREVTRLVNARVLDMVGGSGI